MTHDFKAALEDWYSMVNGGMSETAFLDKHQNVMGVALKLADKVTGEPSEGMDSVGWEEDIDPTEVFKAMIAQAQKEIE